MKFNRENYNRILDELKPYKASLIAVSKTQSVEAIQSLYDYGQRDFAENYVAELSEKQSHLPGDINWHFIGHLQSNKVKSLSSSISLIHGIDSLKLLQAVNKNAEKNGQVQSCLLQVHIAREESKFGFAETEIEKLLIDPEFNKMQHIRIQGLMGMATNTEDDELIQQEFRSLKKLYDKISGNSNMNTIEFKYLSMGMSADYKIALEEGSNMIRIGTAIFGERIQPAGSV